MLPTILRRADEVTARDGVEDTMFEAKDTQKIRGKGIGVDRIFDWRGPKPQITCNDVIRNFEEGIFCGAKLSLNEISEAVAWCWLKINSWLKINKIVTRNSFKGEGLKSIVII